MAKKKSSTTAADKELRSTVKKLRSRLERAEAKSARWKERARTLKASHARSQARVATLEKRVRRLSRHDATSPPPARAATTPPEAAVTTESAETPNADWTVVQLRAEARARGLAGVSQQNKAQLLASLR